MTIFRNDDVNPNSNIEDIKKIYALIKQYVPDAKIYSAINIFAKTSDNGSAYQQIVHNEIDFKDVDKMFDFSQLPFLENIISHGVWHLDHKHTDPEVQLYSIVSSCRLLNTNIFIPPFWRWNATTQQICRKNNIKLWVNEPWVNLDDQPFDPSHKFYLLHSWKHTPESFEQILKRGLDSQKE